MPYFSASGSGTILAWFWLAAVRAVAGDGRGAADVLDRMLCANPTPEACSRGLKAATAGWVIALRQNDGDAAPRADDRIDLGE
jgi:hypothetical protein